MKFETILEEIENDSIINESKLDAESLKIPALYAKWYRILVTEFRILSTAEAELDSLNKHKTEYYLGRCPDEVYKEKPLNLRIIKSDLDVYLSADPEIVELKQKIKIQRMKVDTVENFIKTLNNRGFNIKNAIDFRRFQAGLN